MAHVERTAIGVKATASRDEAYGHKGRTVDDVRIEPSKNGGYAVRVSYRTTEKRRRGGMLDAPTGYSMPETLTFESFDSLVAGLKKCFGAK